MSIAEREFQDGKEQFLFRGYRHHPISAAKRCYLYYFY